MSEEELYNLQWALPSNNTRQSDSVIAFQMALTAEREKSTKKETDNMFLNILESIDGIRKEEKSLKSNYIIYQEWFDKNLSTLIENLQAYFPNRWELEEVSHSEANNHRFSTFIEDIIDMNSENVVDKLIYHRNYNTIHSDSHYNLLIYFPIINITNSINQKHVIKDLWIKMKFNRLLKVLQFGGVRSTRSYIEHRAQYNHSHMNSEPYNTKSTCSSCCLGNTHYQTLLTSLQAGYNENDIALFFQQLEDYLSWESLEGGPYHNIENLTAKNYNPSTDNRQRISNNSDLIIAYRSFLKKFPNGYKVELRNNGIFHDFKVIIDEEFKQKVESICPNELKTLYDTINKVQYVEDSTRITLEYLNTMNASFKNNGKLFTFKGEDIYYKIEDSDASRDTQINDLKVMKMAPQVMIVYIATMLEKEINTYYIKKLTNEFSTGNI